MNSRGEERVDEGSSVSGDADTGESILGGAVRPVRGRLDVGDEFGIGEKLLDAGNKVQRLEVEAFG